MTPWWVVVAAALVMGVVGHLTGQQLATGGYDQTAETGSAVSRSPKGNGRSPR